jgi:hypothetical protein
MRRCPSRRSRCKESMIRSLRAVKSLSLDRRRISSVLTTFRPTLDTNDDEHGTFPLFLPQTHALFHLLFATTCLFFLLLRVIRGSGQPRVSYETDLPANGGVTFFSSPCNEISVWGSERSISKSNDGQRFESAARSAVEATRPQAG